MKFTVKEISRIISYLKVVQCTTESAVSKNPASLYGIHMEIQLKEVTELIERLENTEI